MDFVKIEVDGLDQVLRDLRRMKNTEIPKTIQKANKDAAKMAEEPVKAEAPKRTGQLARSVRATATKKTGQIRVGYTKRVPYAGPIHFGWGKRNIRKNEFIYRGINRVAESIRGVYVKAIDDIIDRFNRGRF